MKRVKFISALVLGCFLILSFLIYSCSNNNPVTSASGPQSASVSMVAPATTNNQGLTITSAKFLIEFVKLEMSRGHDDADLKEGPFVVDVSMNSAVPTEIALSNVPNGTYTEVHFKIHKHTPNEVVIDPDFGTTGVGYSGIISGTYNGVAFTYRTAITSSQEIDIDPPLVVPISNTPKPGISLAASANVTLLVDPSMWFVVNGQIMDPLNPVNQQVIDESIRASFRQAFEDNDHDGHPDGHH